MLLSKRRTDVLAEHRLAVRPESLVVLCDYAFFAAAEERLPFEPLLKLFLSADCCARVGGYNFKAQPASFRSDFLVAKVRLRVIREADVVDDQAALRHSPIGEDVVFRSADCFSSVDITISQSFAESRNSFNSRAKESVDSLCIDSGAPRAHKKAPGTIPSEAELGTIDLLLNGYFVFEDVSDDVVSDLINFWVRVSDHLLSSFRLPFRPVRLSG